jgi:hypothetical protein
MQTSYKIVIRWFVLIAGISIFPLNAWALSEEVFNKFLDQGKWSQKADDNISGENLSSDLIKKIIDDYHAHPDERDAQIELGLLALAMGVAEWGVADPAGLPPDPANKNWESDTGSNSGKHLMSYSVGGVGISHADQGDLLDFISFVSDEGLIPNEHKAAFQRLANSAMYVHKKNDGYYDQLRAAGGCAAQQFDTDLMGETFNHFKVSHKEKYCSDYANKSLKASDWRVFRTWIRAALRTKPGQEWLIKLWMDKYWFESLKNVPGGEGQIEEALVNVRVRNSFPTVADKAPTRYASDTKGRIQRELDAYDEKKHSTYARRCGIMLRPIVLYRHFAGKPQLDIQCPPQNGKVTTKKKKMATPLRQEANSASTLPQMPNGDIENLATSVKHYMGRYAKLTNHYRSAEDDRGRGIEELKGLRNFRAVLPGILYRAGGNNAYRTPKLNNEGPLPPEGIDHLCNEGFSQAIYLYKKGYQSLAKSCPSWLGESKFQYKQISVFSKPGPGMREILAQIHAAIVGKDHRPILVHCYNGYHESNFVSAIALKQFCGWDTDNAKEYWVKTSKPLKTQEKLLKSIAEFKPYADLDITTEQRALVCFGTPPVDTKVDW